MIGYVTFKNHKEAHKICSYLLSQKLIACANILAPHTSLYEWQGKNVTSKEVAVIFKTQKKHVKTLTKEIEKLHSYDVPCIVFWPIQKGSKHFLKWIKNQTEV